MFWSDMAGNPELGPKTSTFEKTVYPVTTILLLVMSSNWFLQIHKGAMKVQHNLTQNIKQSQTYPP